MSNIFLHVCRHEVQATMKHTFGYISFKCCSSQLHVMQTSSFLLWQTKGFSTLWSKFFNWISVSINPRLWVTRHAELDEDSSMISDSSGWVSASSMILILRECETTSKLRLPIRQQRIRKELINYLRFMGSCFFIIRLGTLPEQKNNLHYSDGCRSMRKLSSGMQRQDPLGERRSFSCYVSMEN